MSATTQIINNGASLKIITVDGTRNILKQQIREVSPLADGVIKIDIGLGSLSNIFITHADVCNPVTASPEALVEAINAMLLNTPNLAGVSTEAKQDAEITELQNIKTNQLLSEPVICDEKTPNTVYKGYAAPGSLTSDAVWAIQKITSSNDVITTLWAGGNKNFDKIWNNRKTLQYS
ncbi:MAG: hypothetical protein IT233_09050 [Bacteroidia bacterium]|nr:hypothetical protein [Bacteroidia bacterium]